MSTDEIVRRVRMDGWCVIPEVIPEREVDAVRDMVVEEEATASAEHEAFVKEMRAKGHRIGGQGIDLALGLIRVLPDISKYFADEAILGAAERMLGKHVRISTVTGLINSPGVKRGYWHSDWPFNQTTASHVPAPYPDAVMHLSSIFMLTAFSKETGGTLIVPGSHRWPNNPSGDNGVDRDAPYPTEMTVVGGPGDTVFYDSRLWHSVAENPGDTARVAISVRYARGGLTSTCSVRAIPIGRRSSLRPTAETTSTPTSRGRRTRRCPTGPSHCSGTRSCEGSASRREHTFEGRVIYRHTLTLPH